MEKSPNVKRARAKTAVPPPPPPDPEADRALDGAEGGSPEVQAEPEQAPARSGFRVRVPWSAGVADPELRKALFGCGDIREQASYSNRPREEWGWEIDVWGAVDFESAIESLPPSARPHAQPLCRVVARPSKLGVHLVEEVAL